MKRLILRLTAFILFFPIVNSLKAQTDPINVITTAVPFLRISPDARAGGMGDLGIATSPDAASGFYNLAKTPFAEHPTGMGLTYTPWLKDLGLNDVYLLAASGYHKTDDDQQAISASIRYFSLGNIQFTDYSGNELGQGMPREFCVDLGYSRKLSDKLGIGLALRYINSDLKLAGFSSGTTYKPGNAVAADISFFYNGKRSNGQGWSYGLAVSNLGTKIGYTDDATEKEFIPANLGIGATYTAVFDEENKITFGIDLNKLLVPPAPTDTSSAALTDYETKTVVSSWFSSFSGPNQPQLVDASIGIEYVYENQFWVRTGYFYENQLNGGRQYFTMGVGLKYNVLGLNFSYLVPSGSGVTRNPLSNTIRFGLSFDLDKQQ
jgi:hypothetical protein